jgi:hypothetical protein
VYTFYGTCGVLEIMYKLTDNDLIFRESDSAFIPPAEGNMDYQKFVKDIKEKGLSIVEGYDIVSDSYIELRQKEYPSIQDQMDMQFWDKENGTSHWKDTIQTIKNKYPKSIASITTLAPLPEWVQKLVE